MKKLYSATTDHIQFSQHSALKFKLKPNNNTHVTYKEDGEIILKQMQSKSTLRINKPFPIHELMSYFQIQITQSSQSQLCLAVGVTTDTSEIPKLCNNILMEGSAVYQNGKKAQVMSWNQKVNDRLGCGYMPQRDQVLFTYNGQICKSVKVERGQQYYGIISLKNPDQTVRVLNMSNMMFKLDEFREQLQKNVRSKLQNISHEIKKKNKQKMVMEYLQFSGFQKTAQLYKTQLQSHNLMVPQFQYKTNNYATPTINLKPPSKLQEKISQLEEQLKQFQKSSSSSSYDERLHFGDTPPSSQSFQSSSSSEQEWYSMDVFFRKQHYLPQKKKVRHPAEVKILKRERKERKKKQKRQKIQKFKQEKRMEEEQESNLNCHPNVIFLNQDMPLVISNIEKGNFEKALMTLAQKLPQLIRQQTYIMSYFNAHMFLKIIKKDGPLRAIEFAKEERFLTNQNILFPFYVQSTNSIEQRPIKQILLRLDGAFDEHKQYQALGMFIKQLVLRKMGYYSYSELQYNIKHYHALKLWMDRQQVPSSSIVLP